MFRKFPANTANDCLCLSVSENIYHPSLKVSSQLLRGNSRNNLGRLCHTDSQLGFPLIKQDKNNCLDVAPVSSL